MGCLRVPHCHGTWSSCERGTTGVGGKEGNNGNCMAMNFYSDSPLLYSGSGPGFSSTSLDPECRRRPGGLPLLIGLPWLHWGILPLFHTFHTRTTLTFTYKRSKLHFLSFFFVQLFSRLCSLFYPTFSSPVSVNCRI